MDCVKYTRTTWRWAFPYVYICANGLSKSFEKLQLYGEEPNDEEEERPFNPLDEISERPRRRDQDEDFRSFRGRRPEGVGRPQYTTDFSYRSIVSYSRLAMLLMCF